MVWDYLYPNQVAIFTIMDYKDFQIIWLYNIIDLSYNQGIATGAAEQDKICKIKVRIKGSLRLIYSPNSLYFWATKVRNSLE